MTRPGPRTRPTLARQLRAALALLLVVGGVAGVAWLVYRVTVGRPLLAGEHDHDFGTVELVDRPVTLEHTFTLTNGTGRTLTVAGIKTTCGCTVASADAERIEPGGTLDVPASLTLKADGRKDATIFLNFDGGDRDVLHVTAAARLRRRLSCAAGPARIAPGRPLRRTLIYRDYEGNGTPPPARVSVPDGITAEVSPWEQTMRLRASRGLPARWRATMSLQLAEGADFEGAEVIVRTSTDQVVSIPLSPE